MAKFKNVSPLGALDVPAVGRVIDAGEEFEVDEAVAAVLAGQRDNFEALDAAATKAADDADAALAALFTADAEPIEAPVEEPPQTPAAKQTKPAKAAEGEVAQ